eukprot:3876930-Karenia_brevis.AAC.1
MGLHWKTHLVSLYILGALEDVLKVLRVLDGCSGGCLQRACDVFEVSARLLGAFGWSWGGLGG